mgnify:CR=1 FL=1
MPVFLKTDQDFAAFRLSRSYQTRLLKIRVHISLNQNSPRFGFIISKKTLPKAVDRNLLKRRIKAVLQKIYKQVKPADILFFPQRDLLKQKFAKVGQEVETLFTQARIWKQ